MALYQRENESFLYCGNVADVGRATLLKPMPGRYCWQKMAWLSGFTTSWAGTTADCVPYITCGGRKYAVNFRAGALSGVSLYLVCRSLILPVQAALERLPPSLLQASADLGARPRQTFRYVIAAAGNPGIAAGSIFTFSLTLGDFIVPQLVGPPGYFIGNMVYSQQGAIGNMPMAAAFTRCRLFSSHCTRRS